MKNVKLTKEHIYNPPGKRGISVHYKTIGKTYEKVPEAHATDIVEAGAGEIVQETENYGLGLEAEEEQGFGSR